MLRAPALPTASSVHSYQINGDKNGVNRPTVIKATTIAANTINNKVVTEKRQIWGNFRSSKGLYECA